MELKLSGLRITIDDLQALNAAERAFLTAALQLPAVSFPPAANAPCIAPEDRPDVGVTLTPTARVLGDLAAVVGECVSPPVTLAPTETSRDFTKVFGEAIVPSVPLPPPVLTPVATASTAGSDGTWAAPVSVPPPPPAMPLPMPMPTPPAAIASLPPSVPSVAVVVPPAGAEGMPVLGALPELDSAHMPWDARIHAGTKARNADGTWRKRKSLDPAIVIAVEADLRAAQALPKADAGATPPEDNASTFPKLMAWIAKQAADGKLPMSATFDIVKPLGLMSVVSLKDRPDLLPAAYAALVKRMEEVAAEKAEGVAA